MSRGSTRVPKPLQGFRQTVGTGRFLAIGNNGANQHQHAGLRRFGPKLHRDPRLADSGSSPNQHHAPRTAADRVETTAQEGAFRFPANEGSLRGSGAKGSPPERTRDDFALDRARVG